MNNKDLFNAIHNVDENYIANAWDNTEADRPIVIRPEQRSAKGTARNIILGFGGTAVAAALGFAVLTGANGTLKNSLLNPSSGADDPDESTISYIKDKFDDRNTSAPDMSNFDLNLPLPVEIIAPDGEPLTFPELDDLWIRDKDNLTLSIDEIDKWERIVYRNTVYLAEPGSDVFKKYHVGDEICGLRIAEADTDFIRSGDGTLKYSSGYVRFDGEITVEAVFKKDDGVLGYRCAANGLPVISMDAAAFKQGEYVVKEHNASDVMTSSGGVSEYFGTASGDADRVSANQDQLLSGITLKNLHMTYFSNGEYCFGAELFRVESGSTLYDWAESGLHFPVDNPDGEQTINFLDQAVLFTEYGGNVYAVDDGVVAAIYDKGDYNYGLGNYIVIKHGESKYTRCELLCADKEFPVKVGDKVTKGQVIGYAGTTGDAITDSGKGMVNYRFFPEYGGLFDAKWSLGSLKLPTASAPADFDFLGENKIPAELGSEVYAVDGGLVVYASTERVDGNLGRVICIEHGDGIFTTYAHLANEDGVLVQKGDTVEPGQLIGRVGNSGAVEEGDEHLHYIFGTEIFNDAKG